LALLDARSPRNNVSHLLTSLFSPLHLSASTTPHALVTAASTPPQAAFYVAIVAYLLATLLHFGNLASWPPWVSKLTRYLLILAFIAHGVDIGGRGVAHVHPATSLREAMGFLSWLIMGVYLGVSKRQGLVMLAPIVTPIALIILLLARLSPSGAAVTGLNTLGRIHIASATVGMAIFCLATAVSILYLLQERNLKRKRFHDSVFRKGAALETLDKIASKLVTLGFPIFTLSMILGGFWVAQRGQAFTRIEYPLAGVTWVAFALLMVGRRTRGLQGRRAAWITLVGFLFALLVLALYILRRAECF